MIRRTTFFWILVGVAALMAAQLHVSAEFDPCVWTPNQTHRLPGQGSGHGAGHGCHGCIATSWAAALPHSDVVIPTTASPIDLHSPPVEVSAAVADQRSPRAPPAC